MPSQTAKISSASQSNAASPFEIDLFGDASSQADNDVAPPMSSSTWMNSARQTSYGANGKAHLSSLPAQPNSGTSSSQLTSPSFNIFDATPSRALKLATPNTTSAGVKGGLSAQDLSFFEGL